MDNDSRIKDIIYKRRNGEDLVNDPEAIRSCKNEQNRDVIDNARLGSYDKYGNYVIIPDIKRELIAMPKLIYSTNHTATGVVYDLKATVPIFGDIFFKLSIGKNEAVLSLTESVNREAGGYLEVYDEPIDSFALGKDRLPESIIFRTFHITERPDDFGKRETYEYNNILTRKVYLNLLSKELRKTSVLDEKQAFDSMVSTLKSGGEYGKRVLTEFVDRLKERPAVFEIANTEHYNKAVNEVLLSALDIATTDEDKQNPENKSTYLQVLNARNANIDKDLKIATDRVNEQYVKGIVTKATQEFNGELEKKEDELDAAEEFYARVSGQKRVSTNRKRNLEKPILKQGKESKDEQDKENKPKSKEDKVKAILDKKKAAAKKTPANKKLKAAKGKTASKKLKAGAKAKGKGAKKKKAAVKKKGKKVKKAKAPQKAKAKGASFSAKPAGAAKKKKKAESKNVTIKMSLAAAFKQDAKDPVINVAPAPTTTVAMQQPTQVSVETVKNPYSIVTQTKTPSEYELVGTPMQRDRAEINSEPTFTGGVEIQTEPGAAPNPEQTGGNGFNPNQGQQPGQTSGGPELTINNSEPAGFNPTGFNPAQNPIDPTQGMGN